MRSEDLTIVLKFVRVLVFGILLALATGVFAQSSGVLRVAVFNDENGNGAWDFGEQPFPGIHLSVNGPSGPLSGNTNAQGLFIADNVPPGVYNVRPLITLPFELTQGHDRGDFLVNVQSGTPAPPAQIGIHERCTEVKLQSWIWNVPTNPATPITSATVTFCVTNNASFPIHWIFVSPSGPFSMNPVPIPVSPPIMPGQTGCVTATFNGPPNFDQKEICFVAEFHNQDLSKCCADKICFQVPDKDCYQILEQNIVCNPDGSFNVTLTLQSLFAATTVNGIRIVPAGPGVTITPAAIPVSPPINYAGVTTVTFTVSGPAATQGSTVCFFLALYNGGTQCCSKKVCVTLPICDLCDDAEGVCYAGRPNYANAAGTLPDWAPIANNSMAVVTCYAQFPDDPVVGIFNLWQYACATPQYPTGQNLYSPPPPGVNPAFIEFSNLSGPPQHRWIKRNLGNTFGVCLDNLGNIYVAQTSCYNEDNPPTSGPGANGHGQIYKLSVNTGAISVFNAGNLVVSLPDPNITNLPLAGSPSDERYPEIGDVCFNGVNNVLYATGMDEGAIYTYDMSGNLLGKFDPMTPGIGINNTPGFAPYGELLWACEYHGGRLYYSVWEEDMDNPNPNPAKRNYIRSVQIGAGGLPVPSTDRAEVLTIPPIANFVACSALGGPLVTSSDWSSPISDISFNKQGKMLIAERAMGTRWGVYCNGTFWLSGVYNIMVGHAGGPNAAKTSTYPHYARVMEFVCSPDGWRPSQATFGIGTTNSISNQTFGTNSSGGIDYDYIEQCCPPGSSTPTPANPRVWATADYMFIGGNYWYGLQGLPPTGGALPNSLIVDLDGASSTLSKSTTGDVEVPCPPPCSAGRVSGNVRLQAWIPALSTVGVDYVITGNGVTREGVVMLDNQGNFQIEQDLPTGNYSMVLKRYGHLAKRVSITVANGIATTPPTTLITGDATCDNVVDLGDIDSMISAYLAVADTNPNMMGPQPSSNWNANADADGDGEINLTDIDWAIANYLEQGDN